MSKRERVNCELCKSFLHNTKDCPKRKNISELARNFESVQGAVQGLLLTFYLERIGLEIVDGKKCKERDCSWFKVRQIKKVEE